MKRLVVVLVAVTVLTMAAGLAVAFAQTAPQPGDETEGWWCPGLGGGAWYGSYDPANDPALNRLADKIGIGVDDLASELQAGKSVAEVAEARSVDLQTLVDLMQAPQIEMLKIGVKYGYLTQDQADAMQKFMAERIRGWLERKGSPGRFRPTGALPAGPGFGGMMDRFGGMMGGFGGMMRGFGGMMGPGFGRGMGGFGY